MVIKEPKRLSSKHRSSPSSQHLFPGSWDASPVLRSAVCTAKSEGGFWAARPMPPHPAFRQTGRAETDSTTAGAAT
jgi:hypothetical protein